MNFESQKRWDCLYVKNLSSHSDQNFKIAQFLQTPECNILFNLQETFRGRNTETGIYLILPEMFWLKNALVSNDQSKHILEHNSRKIILDKSLDDIKITVTKANKKMTIIILKHFEVTNLTQFLIDSEENIKSKAISFGKDIGFNERAFYIMSVE